jgi:uncharacterized DUF497 family protein
VRIGQLPNLTVIVVVYTERHGRVRLISARLADRDEREDYYAEIGYNPRR